MDLKEALPTFYGFSADKANGIWRSTFDHSPGCLNNISKIYFAEMLPLGPDHNQVMLGTKMMIKDLMALQQDDWHIQDGLLFLQYEFSTNVMQVLALSRLFSELFTWIANSVSADLDPGIRRLVEAERIGSFLESKNKYIQENLMTVFVLWTGLFFYYQRIKAGFKDLADFYLVHYLGHFNRIIDLGYFSEDTVFALGQLQSWAGNNGMADIKAKCSRQLFLLYKSVPASSSESIVLTFCACGWEDTDMSRTQWCDLALSELDLPAQKRLQVLVSKYEGDSDGIAEGFEEIIGAIDIYHAYLDSQPMPVEVRDFDMARIFSICRALLNTLLASGHIDLAAGFICHFFQIPAQGHVGSSGMMIIQHNTHQGVQYSCEQRVVTSGTDPLVFSPRIMNELNSFLHLTMEATDDPNFRPVWDDEDRRSVGTPAIEGGFSLERTLVEHFALNKADIRELIQSSSKYFLYSEFQLPLQALFVKYAGKALPIVQSFAAPLPIRALKKVLIWEGDCILSETECTGIGKIFEKAGILVKKLRWHESGKTAFLKEYQSEEYDLIWMSCHGQFDHFYPHRSELVLFQDPENPESAASYQEMGEHFYGGTERRLLVLNACDGATTTLANSPGAVGFGASLVSAGQSMMSHQWPCDLYGGGIMGLLLSTYLAEMQDYLSSYQSAVECFIKGRESVLARISGFLDDEEILGRVERADINYQNLYFYGSLTYLE